MLEPLLTPEQRQRLADVYRQDKLFVSINTMFHRNNKISPVQVWRDCELLRQELKSPDWADQLPVLYDQIWDRYNQSEPDALLVFAVLTLQLMNGAKGGNSQQLQANPNDQYVNALIVLFVRDKSMGTLAKVMYNIIQWKTNAAGQKIKIKPSDYMQVPPHRCRARCPKCPRLTTKY